MIVNPDVDSYNLKSPEKIRKTQTKKQPTENQTNIKTEISLNMVVRFSHIECLGGHFAPLPPISYVTGYDILFLHTGSFPYSTAKRYEMVA